jgi:hypothetical protein
VMYSSIHLSLNGAAKLIARRLAELHPIEYSDETSAIDKARRELLRALFDGAVHSRGVLWSGPPPADDPNEPPPLPEPIKWEPIEAGWWSHERYEQYVYRHQETESELEFILPEFRELSGKEKRQPKLIEQIFEGAYLLDNIIVSWNNNSLHIDGFGGDYEYTRIQVSRADIQTHFAIHAADRDWEENGQSEDAPATFEIAHFTEAGTAEKRKTRPPSVSPGLYGWLDEQLQKEGPNWIRSKSNTWLAYRYTRTVPTAVGDADYLRKVIPEWRKKHGLSRTANS